MDVREVSVEYGRTVDLGDYESERLTISLTATVAGDEDAMDVAHELVEQARASVGGWLSRFRQERRDARRLEYRAAEEEDEP